MELDPKKSACQLRWDYPVVNLGINEVRSCCRTPAQKVTLEDVKELGEDVILNSKYQLERRREMLEGVRHFDCKTCWDLEEIDVESPRLGWEPLKSSLLKQHTDLDEEGIEFIMENPRSTPAALRSYNPFMLEISLGNLCDMMCMYCSADYSTQWAKDYVEEGYFKAEDLDKYKPMPEFEVAFWDWYKNVGRYSLDRIGIIGGEPLINDRFYPFIDRLIELSTGVGEKKSLWIVTNLNTPKVYLDRFIDRLEKLEAAFNIEIHASMESVGSRAEYIRYGVKWNRFDRNVRTLLELPNKFSFGFQIANNILSISSLPNFLRYARQLHDEFERAIALKQNIVHFPNWQSPFLLTSDFAKYVDEAIEYLVGMAPTARPVADIKGTWDNYITFLMTISSGLKKSKSDENSQKHFYHWFSKYDRKRKTSLVETFPEYKDFWEYCRQLTNGECRDFR